MQAGGSCTQDQFRRTLALSHHHRLLDCMCCIQPAPVGSWLCLPRLTQQNLLCLSSICLWDPCRGTTPASLPCLAWKRPVPCDLECCIPQRLRKRRIPIDQPLSDLLCRRNSRAAPVAFCFSSGRESLHLCAEEQQRAKLHRRPCKSTTRARRRRDESICLITAINRPAPAPAA